MGRCQRIEAVAYIGEDERARAEIANKKEGRELIRDDRGHE